MTASTGPDFATALAKLPLRSVHGLFYRAVPEMAAVYALEDGPSYQFKNRYNLTGRFGALYFGDRMEVCRATVEKRGLLTARSLPHVLLSFDVRADHILDLNSAACLQALHLSQDALIQSAEIPFAYDVPQRVAQAAYACAKINGLLVPDATQTGLTLVLYPARLVGRDMIRLKDRLLF